jgi:hypothetical protein
MKSPFGADHERYVQFGITLDLFKGHPKYQKTLSLAPEICSRISPLREKIEGIADQINSFESSFGAKCEFTIYLYDELKLMHRLKRYRERLGENVFHEQFDAIHKKIADPLEDYYAIVSFLGIRNEKNPTPTRTRELVIWLFAQDIEASAGYASFKSNKLTW